MATRTDVGKVKFTYDDFTPAQLQDIVDGVVSKIKENMQFKVSDESVLIASNARADLQITFDKAFSSIPTVIAVPYTSTGGGVEIAVKNITTTGFTVNMKNEGASSAYFKVSYLALNF